ncbi:TetR/AcrR family transcriptional regulator [Streptomyces sp. S6]
MTAPLPDTDTDTDTDPAPARRGRPRDAARDRALIEATLAVLAESGYGALTTAAVAARAGVSTATLYRRWSSKEELVLAAAADFAKDLERRPDTGTLEGDLRALLRDKAAGLTGENGRLLRALIGEAAHNAALAEAVTAAFTTPVRERVEEIVRRAVERGEIAPVRDADLVADFVTGPMVSRLLLTARPTEARDAEGVAERMLPFLLRALGASGGGEG